MEFMVISENDFSEFSKTYKDANFWQSTSMAHLRAWNGWKYEYVGVKEQDLLIAASMISYREVFLGSTFVQAVRGFCMDYENTELVRFFHEHLLIYLKSKKCMYFKMDPYLPYKQRDINGDLVDGGFDHSEVINLFTSLGYHHMGFLTGNSTTREPNWMFVCNVDGKSEEELFKEFHHLTKRSIQKVKKLGISIREATNEDLPKVKKIMNHTANRRGFDDHDLHYYEGLLETFGKDGNLKILLAEFDTLAYKKGILADKEKAIQELQTLENIELDTKNSDKHAKKIQKVQDDLDLSCRKLKEIDNLNKEHLDVITLSVGTFMTFGKEVLYLYGGSYQEFMKFNGSYALQWEMIRYAIQHNKERYNFYGISGIFDKDSDGYGIYEFKKGFTGNVEELIGDFYYYLQPNKYKLYEMLRNVKKTLKG